jgi:hypothetical protein
MNVFTAEVANCCPPWQTVLGRYSLIAQSEAAFYTFSFPKPTNPEMK